MASKESGCARFVQLIKIHLNEGVTYSNLVIFFLAVSFGSILLLVFADASVGYVLENVLKEQAEPIQGVKAGQVVFYSEILIAATIWAWGMLSDRVGRRWVFAAGTFLIAASFIAMPFVTSFIQVVGIRLLFAPGAAAVSSMLMALICDYPRDDEHTRSRGKASAIMGILAGLGAIFALLALLNIPVWLSVPCAGVKDQFCVTPTGTMVMFFSAAFVALLCGGISLFGLAKQLPTSQYTHASFKELLLSGFTAMSDPYVVLAYLASFSARGDSSVVTLFLSFWIQKFAHGAGISSSMAVARAGLVTGLVQVAALVAAPFVGVIADKFSRALVTTLVAICGVTGYLLLGLLADPYDLSVQLCLAVVFLGIGEMGMLIMSQSILGLHAPTATRGSISGFWALCGSLGIMFGSGVGGVLFDYNVGAPFFIFAGFNCIVATYALILYVLERKKIVQDVPKLGFAEGSSSIEREKLVVQ